MFREDILNSGQKRIKHAAFFFFFLSFSFKELKVFPGAVWLLQKQTGITTFSNASD